MNRLIAAAAAVLCATAAAAQAVSPGDTAGVQALVQRARSELAANQAARALSDADAALAIDASDRGAADVKARAQASLAGQGQAGAAEASAAALNGQVKRFNDDIAARNAGREAAYEAGVAEYKARVHSDAVAYAQAQAAYRAQLKDIGARRDADLAAWRTRAAACRRGDRSQCLARRHSPAPPIPEHPLAPN